MICKLYYMIWKPYYMVWKLYDVETLLCRVLTSLYDI